MKHGSAIRPCFCPDIAVVEFHNLLCYGQANAGTFYIYIKAVKKPKDFLSVFFWNTLAVVGAADVVVLLIGKRADPQTATFLLVAHVF